MKKTIVIVLIGAVILCLSLLVYQFYKSPDPNFEKRSLNIQLQGIVDEISYSEKGYPTVEMDGRLIYIPAANDKLILIGDSIVKNSGKNVVYVYRNERLFKEYRGPVEIYEL